MRQGLKYTILKTEMGWVGILGSSKGLLRVTLPKSSAQEARQQLGDRVKKASRSDKFFAGLSPRLRNYFAGHPVAFPDELDLSLATTFQHQAWAVTRLIPYGETRSYSWVARQLGKAKAGRAVGRALGQNPLPIITPCHRVVAKNGKLGGYSGGVKMKRHLLKLEAKAI
jgi:methylated-DNA-[protein]-cysteine S-methyltransferase